MLPDVYSVNKRVNNVRQAHEEEYKRDYRKMFDMRAADYIQPDISMQGVLWN